MFIEMIFTIIVLCGKQKNFHKRASKTFLKRFQI